MFTGITRGLFPVLSVERQPSLLRYRVDLGSDLVRGLELGASVSIDGVCQTVVAVDGTCAEFEAIEETLRLTTLDGLEVGQKVSVERSLTFGAEIGGHVVAGHVWGTGVVDAVETPREGDYCMWVRVPPAWMKYILPKGFIAVDGSSLTVGRTESSGRFSLHLIPETLSLTKLGSKRPGDAVNLELDAHTVAIVDTVERVLEQRERA